MNIIVNGTPLLAPLTGIGQYIRHLFSAMDNIPDAKLTMYYGTYCQQGASLPSPETTRSAQKAYGLLQRFIPRPRSLRRVAERAVFAYHSRRHMMDGCLYHEPNYVPLPYPGPTVITVCDLSCFDHPETHPEERVRLMQRDMPPAIERADHIIVISDATKEALQKWFNVASERITTTYLAADPRFHPRPQETLIPQLGPLGLSPGAYLLCVGTLEPRKNLGTLFSAYAALPDALRRRFPLVVAGMRGWHTDQLMHDASKLLEKDELRLLGYVADETIPALYAGAAAFAYPSRYEGFGLPALEAMASGVPVLTSNRTSLPEVVGKTGLMTDPDDVDGMRECLHQLLEDRIYAERLGYQGLERAATFSWDRCAHETFTAYEKVMKTRGYL